MATVTYKNQPGIHKTRGSIPLAGNAHIYRVNKLLWPKEVEDFLETQFIGITLHLCCGKSKLGDIRLDLFENDVDIIADASKLPIKTRSVDTVLVDPPYNGKFQWNHDLLSELPRVARQRIIFQHWFSPVNKSGFYKKNWSYSLTGLYAWMPKSYFGRMQIISIFDKG
jgi:hypothetical protein